MDIKRNIENNKLNMINKYKLNEFGEINRSNIKKIDKIYNYCIDKLNKKYNSKKLLKKLNKYKVNNLERITFQNESACSKCNKIPTYINKINNELLCWYHGLLEHNNE